MSTEKYWQDKEYAKDIHDYLCEKEKKRYVFWGRSDLLNMRKSILEWLKSIVDKKGFCTTVFHLAVYLLDIFMDNHYCAANHLKITALGCLNVAVKLEDETFPPKSSEYVSMLGSQYKKSDFVHMEMTILSFYNCSILFPTAAHFVEYYSLYALSPNDATEGVPLYNPANVKVYADKYIKYFLDISIIETNFYNYAPSLVAAAIILSTRTSLSLVPPWPVSLQTVTCYRYGQVKVCSELLLRNLNFGALLNIAQKYATPQQSISIVKK